jgi:hypothetical protein
MNVRIPVLATIAFAIATIAGVEDARAQYGMAGCGLGSIVIKENSTIMQVLAATTNGTSGSQTFGITTGTSNCTKGGVVVKSKEQEAFVEANFSRLQQDMAKGGGEYLAALTELMQCKDTMRPAVYSFAQQSYSSVFPSSSTTPMQALYAFKLGISQDERFLGACAQL